MLGTTARPPQLHMIIVPGLLAIVLACPLSDEEPPESPRLVVVLCVDQLIPEQLERLEPWLDGGLARFGERGRTFSAAELDYYRSETGPGHATLATGLLPRHHGISANGMLDPQTQTRIECTVDPTVATLAPGGVLTEPETGGSSARHLLRPGLAEYLRERWPASRSVSISGKARAAVFLAGRAPQWALWWDRRAGGFTSSSAYGELLPDWVLSWNRGWSAQANGRDWRCSFEGELDGSGTAPDERAGESAIGAGVTFPRAAPRLTDDPRPIEYQRLAGFVSATPLLDRFVIDLALAAVDSLELGADGDVDLLALGLSACDKVGHRAGPYSREVTDTLLRLDDELGRLFGLLDERLGPDAWLAALASDHGVMELPEALVERGIATRRLGTNETRRALAAAREALSERFEGEFFGLRSSGDGLILDRELVAAAGADLAQVRALARSAYLGVADYAADAYTFDELASPQPPRDAFAALARNSFRPEHEVDVVLRFQPWLLHDCRLGTDHGSPYPYDRRIVLSFLGPGFAPAKRWERASPTDLVPTLLERLGVPLPEGLDGRPLD
ncbi:MAG: alkaline phosphatase family protein [Planctomycetota bacterium]|nr:alkaline phosphatase family protein [Planctomycetota bacterium]